MVKAGTYKDNASPILMPLNQWLQSEQNRATVQSEIDKNMSATKA